MEEKDLTQLKEMIERLGSADNFNKWAGQVAECIEHCDIIVVFNSQSGTDNEEAEAGVRLITL